MRSKNNPKISVVIPNYNRAHNLDELLADCMRQTSKPFEIIVQDDSFNKKEIVKIDRVMSSYKSVQYARNSKNIGLAENVNRAIKKASGEYVVIVNNDDRVSPRYIEEIQKFVRIYPNFKAYTTNACAITDNGTVFGDYRLYSEDTVIEARKGIAHLWNNYFLNLICISGATIYERRFIQEHLLMAKYGNEADLNHALNLLSSQDIMYVNLPIYYVRMNASNTSVKIRSTAGKLEAYIKNCLNIYEKYSSKFTATPMYMLRPKTVYFLQLFYKYRYSVTEIKSILSLENWSNLLLIVMAAPTYVFVQLKRRFLFQLNQFTFKKYYPANHSS